MTVAVCQHTMDRAADFAEQAGAFGRRRLFVIVTTTVAVSVRMTLTHRMRTDRGQSKKQ
jgi:hypothetical protein